MLMPGQRYGSFVAFCLDVRTLNFLPTNGFSTKPLKVKLLAGEQISQPSSGRFGSSRSFSGRFLRDCEATTGSEG